MEEGQQVMIIAITGISILMISTIGALLWARRDASGQQRQAKILLFALYFWVLTFIQLIAVAIVYSVLNR